LRKLYIGKEFVFCHAKYDFSDVENYKRIPGQAFSQTVSIIIIIGPSFSQSIILVLLHVMCLARKNPIRPPHPGGKGEGSVSADMTV